MIELQNVTKGFHKKSVLQNLTFSAAIGDAILIEGINGCGKSTLLKILAGLMEPDTGDRILENDQITIGAFIENPAFLEQDTLAYNLKFLYNLTHPFDEAHVTTLCDYFDLPLNEKIRMKNYSIGMRQKAAIIQAIMEDQTILLLDEPTRGLDKASCQAFCDLMNTYIAERHKILIICAHDGVDAIHFTRKLQLEDGSLHDTSL